MTKALHPATRSASIVALLLVLTSFARLAQGAPFLIDTTVGWNRMESIAPFGDGAAGESYGQTFVVPASNPTLTKVSFWLQHMFGIQDPNPDTSGQPLQFRAHLMAWDGNSAAGPVLFSSALQAILPSQNVMTEFEFPIAGGLALTPGQEYIAFVNASEAWDSNTTRVRLGFRSTTIGPDVYPAGRAWTQDSANVFGNVLLPWDNPFGTSDLVVRLTFADVSQQIAEPSMLFLLGVGLVLWLCAGRATGKSRPAPARETSSSATGTSSRAIGAPEPRRARRRR